MTLSGTALSAFGDTVSGAVRSNERHVDPNFPLAGASSGSKDDNRESQSINRVRASEMLRVDRPGVV